MRTDAFLAARWLSGELKRTFFWRVLSTPDSRAISAYYIVSSRSSCWV